MRVQGPLGTARLFLRRRSRWAFLTPRLCASCAGLLARVRSLECGGTVNVRSVAEDMGTVAAGGAFGYVFHRIIAKEPAAPFWLRIAPWLIGGGCALFNIVRTSERRWEAQTERNAARKALLLQQAARVEERIAIMLALSKPTPALPLPEHVAVTVPNA